MSEGPPRRRARRPRGAGAITGAVVLGAALICARPADAYVRYVTEYGKFFQWTRSCVHVTGYPNDLPDMTAEQVATAASGAAAAWSNVGLSCTYLAIDIALSSEATPTASADNKNSLIFRHNDWCNPSDSPWTCSYDQAALAITSVFVQRSTGHIQEADIEVNDRWFSWTDLALNPDEKTKQDLQNALTHEMGHLVGLDHSCFNPAPNLTRPTDNLGNPVPDCATAPMAIRDTTMFASATPGDLSKRTLEPDDQQAVCDIYPLNKDPVYCPAEGGGTSSSCAVAEELERPSLGAFGLALAPAMMVVAIRRRRTRPQQAHR
jgi:hypothetical protein